MSKEESYNEGFHEGRRWAEVDITNKEPVNAIAEELKAWYASNLAGPRRAHALGVVRGYRDTLARYEKGEITWETFESAPVTASTKLAPETS